MMERLKILIAEADHFVSSCLPRMLEDIGHTISGCVRSGAEAIASAEKGTADLILIDVGLADIDGLKASRAILGRQLLPIIILTAHPDPDLFEQAEAIGVSGYLIKPFTQKDLAPALLLAWSRFKQLRLMRQKIDSLQQTLKERKLIEQAKGLLMLREKISEAEAFRRIQQMSRNQHIAMSKLAEAIILAGKLGTERNAAAPPDRPGSF